MKQKRLLYAMGWVKDEYIEEMLDPAMEREHRRAPKKKLWLIAAVIAALLLTGCTIVVAMRLQHMTTDEPPFTNLYDEERSIISLQGFQGSKNYEAFREWKEFLNAYDPDKSILYANNNFEVPDAYYSYGCYSQEMVDKAAEICEKYGLEPLGKPSFYRQPEHLFEVLGIKSTFSDPSITEGRVFSGYCYGDGTFQLEGDMELTGQWNQIVSFNIRSVQKTSFDGVNGSIGALDTYDQWEYTMKDGTPVLLVLRENEGRIIVNKEDCFVVVGVSSPLGIPDPVPVPNERAFMETFCEAFDFKYTAQQVDPTEAYALECEEEPHTYGAYIQYLLTEHAEHYPNLMYALMDINDDGQEELLLRCDDTPKGHENSFFSIKGMRDGDLVSFGAGGCYYLCQGNVIESYCMFEDEPRSHDYIKLGQDYFENYIAMLRYSEEDGKLYDVFPEISLEISEEEHQAFMEQYPHIDIDFKPVSEFRDNEASS